MRVAICNAERLALEALRTMVAGSSLVNRVYGFLSLDDLWDGIETGIHFDLVFLQMEWKEQQDGIDFAANVMKVSPTTQIIYVAEENNRLAQQIFLKPANICGYLVKPVEMELLDKLLDKAWHIIEESDAEKLVVHQRGVVHAIPLRKICYLESRGHQIFIHTFKERVVCYDRLESMKEHVPSHFQQCHKSYLVNFDNVRRIEHNRIILKTEEEIPISRSKYAQVREAYSRYVGQEQEMISKADIGEMTDEQTTD